MRNHRGSGLGLEVAHPTFSSSRPRRQEALKDIEERADFSFTHGAADALRNIGDFASDLVEPTVRLGVTGLARSGKTVFITALVHNLMAGARMPFFDAVAHGRVLRVYLEPQPDDQVPRFDYERHMADLTASPPRWPESTRRISQLRLAVEYEPQSFWKRRLGYNRLNVDIVDYPGEWLLDLPLLRLDYRQWSQQALERSRSASRRCRDNRSCCVAAQA